MVGADLIPVLVIGSVLNTRKTRLPTDVRALHAAFWQCKRVARMFAIKALHALVSS